MNIFKRLFNRRKKGRHLSVPSAAFQHLEESHFFLLLEHLLDRDINRDFSLDDDDKRNICYTDLWKEVGHVFPHNEIYSISECGEKIPDVIVMCGMRYSHENRNALYLAQRYNIPIVLYEDGFIRSASTYLRRDIEDIWWRGISFVLDTQAAYFDATRASRLEQMLNAPSLVISAESRQRARACMQYITEHHLTKYNHQPIFKPAIGRPGVEKVLVVDQSYGDMSICRGGANDKTFERMLEAAIREHPHADIIVKTHPDTIAGRGGYYTHLKAHDNIFLQTEAINPIALLGYVDEVYVCTTQLGFEALMCGKRVRVFGLPFYAGWGVTQDAQRCRRRQNERTIEEIFYIAYILYTRYYNPLTHQRCEIEEALKCMKELRERFHARSGMS